MVNMSRHFMELPSRILVGTDVISELPDITKGMGKPLVLTGNTTRKIAGDRILSMFRDASLGIASSGDYEEVRNLESDHTDTDFVICVGGGTIIDLGKMVAYDKNIPFVSVPTTLSHDGIASDRASITHGHNKHSVKARPPVAVVADLEILKKCPYRMIASGSADVISNISAVFDWRLGRDKKGEYYADYSAEVALLSAQHVMESAEMIRNLETEGIRNLVEALISSGISISLAGSSRPASGSEHMFSHALDMVLGDKKAMHGEQCGIGTIVTAYMQGQDWQKIKSVLETLGAPVTARQLGISQSDIVSAFLNAPEVRERYSILDEKPPTREYVLNVLKATGVV